MDGDAVCPTELSEQSHGNRIGFNRATRFSNVRNVIDIDAQAGHGGCGGKRILFRVLRWA